MFLVDLDLSWNSFGDDGAVLVAGALRDHEYLMRLNLAQNDIGERGTLVLGDTLKQNKGLKILILDDNPIGRAGGRAILRALRTIAAFGWNRDISLRKCNFRSAAAINVRMTHRDCASESLTCFSVSVRSRGPYLTPRMRVARTFADSMTRMSGQSHGNLSSWHGDVAAKILRMKH